MKTKITKAEYLQIVGLLALAKTHNKALQEIDNAVAGILGAEDEGGGGRPYYGHVSDEVYDDEASATALLKRCKIAAPK